MNFNPYFLPLRVEDFGDVPTFGTATGRLFDTDLNADDVPCCVEHNREMGEVSPPGTPDYLCRWKCPAPGCPNASMRMWVMVESPELAYT